MDNLVDKLNEILGSEEGNQKLAEVAKMLGVPSDSFDLSKLSSVLEKKPDDNAEENTQNPDDETLPDIDISSMLKITSALSGMKKNNKNTALIKALKPHIKDENKHKVDEALKILQLVELFPILKDMGIFNEGGLLGGFFGGNKNE
jgi:hypothetical protein